MKVSRGTLLIIIAALVLPGCTAIKASLATAQGNANYTVRCPIILPDGTTATYTDQDGNVLPAMAEFKVDSGRVLTGGANIDIKGCIKIEIPRIEQGEDRSQGVVAGAGNVLTTAIRWLFGG